MELEIGIEAGRIAADCVGAAGVAESRVAVEGEVAADCVDVEAPLIDD